MTDVTGNGEKSVKKELRIHWRFIFFSFWVGCVRLSAKMSELQDGWADKWLEARPGEEGETGKDSHGWGREGSLVMESFQTPFIVCLRTGALQEQDEPAPLELLGALQRNPDTEMGTLSLSLWPRLHINFTVHTNTFGRGSAAAVKAVITFYLWYVADDSPLSGCTSGIINMEDLYLALQKFDDPRDRDPVKGLELLHATVIPWENER